MNLFDRILSWTARRRGFVLGPGVVEWGDVAWGHDKSQFAPPSYGDYIASSGAVYTCATLRASLLASLPIKLYRRNRRKEKVEVERGPLVDLLSRVNPYWTRYRLLYMSELTLCLWGESTWFLERGKSGTGEPKEIWWGRPDRTSILPDPINYIKGFLYEPLNGGRDIPFSPQEVIWIPYPNPLDEYAGLSPLAAARASADYATEAVRANTNLFKSGLQIGGIVMPPAGSPRELTSDQAKELDAYFTRRFAGQDKAHRWATMRHHYEIWQGGTTPKEADFLGGLAFSIEDVARAYKVPLDLIGGQRTYQNVEAALKALWMHCILPEAEFFATELTEKLLPMFPAQAGESIEFDISGVQALQESQNDKWTRAKDELDKGTLTINEWRDEAGRPAVPWGEVFWAPSSLTPVKDSEKEPPPPAPAQSPVDEDQPGEQMDGQTEDEAVARALVDVRRRQQSSIRARAGGAIPFAYARWVKEYRIALRKAGLGEAEAQRLAHRLNTELYEQVRREVTV